MGKRKVIIMLSRQHSLSGKFLYWTCGRSYTHASIAFEESGQCFYSFNFSGFSIEHPRKRKNWNSKYRICYEIEVGETEYKKLKQRIRNVKKRRKEYRYSTFGLLLCILRIPHKFQKQYFCSQFVAETLELCTSVPIEINPSICFPKHLDKVLRALPFSESKLIPSY